MSEIETQELISQDQFYADVRHEIEMLKQHATPEELSRLEIENFDPNTIDGCIYGQMTGTCKSGRAKELMDIACTRIFSKNTLQRGVRKTFQDVQENINGEYRGQDWVKYDSGFLGRRLTHISALEGFIDLAEANNAGILAYLKGETDELILTKEI